MSSSDNTRCCLKCKASCNTEFKQIVNLKSSGLVIYSENSSKNIRYKNIASIILHNSGLKELKKFNYVAELCQYKTKCYQCQKVIQRVRDLLDNIDIIRKNEVLAICDHCKRSNVKLKCKRCEYMLERFISCRVQQTESLREEYAAWWQTVKNTLMTIIDVQNTCPHRVCFVRDSDPELRKLINFLKMPSPTIHPRVDAFPSRKIVLPLPVDKETKNVLLEIINEISLDKLSKEDSASVLSTCMCRYFNEQKNERMHPKVSLELPVIKDNKIESSELNDALKLGVAGMLDGDGDYLSKQNALKDSKMVSDRRKNIRSLKKTGEDGELNEDETNKNKTNTKTSPENTKGRKYKLDPEYELMLQLIKIHKEEGKLKPGKTKSTLRILKNMPKIEPLPELPVRPPKPRRPDAHLITAGSTLVCTPHDSLPRVMIRGTRMVSRDQRMKTKYPITLEPILFKNQIQCVTPVESSKSSKTSSSSESSIEEMAKSRFMGKGITKYALSKKEFIDKGWTMLPSTKIMRRMNIYKMEPANPHFDWFKTHAHKRAMFYDTREILAEINENGCGGKWFYKNGSVALHYCNSQGRSDKYRYIIYDLNEDDYVDVKNTRRPLTILACFDYLGNGVVYDQSGKARIKYNQSEGIIIDNKIGVPSKWKWHSLNDPPVLQNVYMDNKVTDDSLLQNFIIPDDLMIFNNDNISKVDDDMLAIEFENFVRGKAQKIMQKMTSYKIRMKAVKINDFFSLRIIDQENIYIIFRNGHIPFKLNIGMRLKSNEIIDTITVDVAEVSTPYDFVPETKSHSDIHEVLRCMQNFSKSRHR